MPREWLEWEYRKSLIVDKLLDVDGMNADIVCLQEVDVDLFPDLQERLHQTYDSVIQKVGRNHNVATVTFVRTTCPFRIVRNESRSRAQIVVLETDTNGSTSERPSRLYLCNVHLDAGANKRDPKLRQYHQDQRRNQLRKLLHRLDLQCKRDFTTNKEVPVVIAGDFNMLRSNPLHESLESGSLIVNGTVRLQDAYLESERLEHGSKTTFPTPKGKRRRRLVKTFGGGSLLDYIWTSDQVQVLDTLVFHPGSLHHGVEAFPSEDHPSDHLPIGIDINWN